MEMQQMKKLVFAIAVACAASTFAKSSTPAGFTDDLDAALAAAKADGKFVYACFSGSDWCGWCVRLEEEVFSKEEFLSAVTNDYHLVFIDSPNDTDLLSERAKVENPKLVDKYEIEGFPTALIFDGEGRKLAKTGYRRGGPAKYAEYLAMVRKEGPTISRREEAFAKVVAPFRDEMRKLGDENRAVIEKIYKEGQAAGLDNAAIEAKIKSEALPGFIEKCRKAIEKFEAEDAPAEIAPMKAKELENAKGWLATLEKL